MKKHIFKSVILPIILIIALNSLFFIIEEREAKLSSKNACIDYASPEDEMKDKGSARNFIFEDTLKENLLVHIPILIIMDLTVIIVVLRKYSKINDQ